MADINLYLILGAAFPLVMAILPFIADKKILALFPFFGAIIAAYEFLGVASDGAITNGSITILSANSGSGDWQAAVLMPLAMVIIDFLMAGYTAVKR